MYRNASRGLVKRAGGGAHGRRGLRDVWLVVFTTTQAEGPARITRTRTRYPSQFKAELDLRNVRAPYAYVEAGKGRKIIKAKGNPKVLALWQAQQ